MLRTISLALVFALATSCSRANRGATSDGAPPPDPLSELDAETGHTWTVRWHDDIHTPAFLEGGTAPMATTADDAARAGRDFLRRHAALFSMGPNDDLVAQDAATDELGMTHARFGEEIAGHPVWGGELLLHFATDGSLIRINGRYIPVAAELGEPLKSKDEARVIAVDDARRTNGALAADSFTTAAPKLYVYPVDAQTAKLAWRVQMEAESDVTAVVLEAFVDAIDGSVLHTADITAYLDGSGVGVLGDTQKLVVAPNGKSYILEDATRGEPPTRTYSSNGRLRLPGTAVRSKDPMRWDDAGDAHGAAVDAHAYVAVAWDYFAQQHGRAGWDGNGKGVHSTVHFGNKWAGAFFNGKQLVFGDGDGSEWLPLSGALDLVAHEFTHGVTLHTARLGVEGQPGALNEAIADVFACLIEGNWQIGEAVHRSSGRKQPLRDLADPHASNLPATMAEYDGAGDVHHNSTIASHAAYVMAQRMPPETVGKIWYRALARYLNAAADFADAADATMAAARDLGADDAIVKEAWVGAGIVQ
jgi:bacillolysin